MIFFIIKTLKRDYMFFMKIKIIIFVIFFSLITNAHAYLDPGTGSFILQLILAGFATFVATIGIYFNRIKLFISKIFSFKKKNNKNFINKKDNE